MIISIGGSGCRRVEVDGVGLLQFKFLRHMERLRGPHGMPASGKTEGKDGLHLLVILDGLVQELSVLGSWGDPRDEQQLDN